MKLIQTKAKFNLDGEIVLHPGISISWQALSDINPPELPPGTLLDLSISLDGQSLLSGANGIVWATYDLRQAEIVQNALLAQNIPALVGKIELMDSVLLLVKLNNYKDVSEAMDFIWRNQGGLRLKPDWTYGPGESNASFEAWLNGY